MKSWNVVFNYFMDIKRYLGNKFTLGIDFKDLVSQYGSDDMIKRLENLQLTQYKNFLLIRYAQYASTTNGESEEGLFDMYDGFYKECRSLVIDLINEEIVLCPFKKFRNINECEETSLENIKNRINKAKLIEITDKLDGSMQSATWYNNEIVMSGSQALDKENSWRLADGYRMLINDEHYINLLKSRPDCTFIFEYISLKDAHVVKYKKEDEGLYLIGIRNSVTGKQYPYLRVIDVANFFGVKTTKIFDKTFEEVFNSLDKYKAHEKEGYVLNIDEFMVKVKCDDYVNIHRILSNVSSINLIIEKIANDEFDDMISKIPTAYRDRVMKVANLIFNYIKSVDKEIKELYNKADKTDKKTFMLWVNNNVSKEYRGYLRNLYLGLDVNYLKSGQRYKKLKEMGINENYSAIFSEEE